MTQSRPVVVKTVEVGMRGEGTIKQQEEGKKEKGVDKKPAILTHPEDLPTSIRPYHGSEIMCV